MREQWALYELSGGFSRPKFPWLEAFVLMPCSFGAALGIKVRPASVTCHSGILQVDCSIPAGPLPGLEPTVDTCSHVASPL